MKSIAQSVIRKAHRLCHLVIAKAHDLRRERKVLSARRSCFWVRFFRAKKVLRFRFCSLMRVRWRGNRMPRFWRILNPFSSCISQDVRANACRYTNLYGFNNSRNILEPSVKKKVRIRSQHKHVNVLTFTIINALYLPLSSLYATYFIIFLCIPSQFLL